jgi:thioredoxin 1
MHYNNNRNLGMEDIRMPDWGKELSPRIRERLAEIGEVTQEDKTRIKQLDNLDSLLKEFFKGQLDAKGLWERLKEFEEQGKQFLLRDAYTKLKASFKWEGLPIKFEETSDGTLSIQFREEEEKALVLELTESNFDEAVKNYPLLVVDCWAEWCAPCKMVAPVIEELAEDYQGKIAFGKLNMDYNPSVVARYQIMSIPTLLIFKNGKLVDQKVGAMPKGVLEPELVKYI